jgi:hypothetical protein
MDRGVDMRQAPLPVRMGMAVLIAGCSQTASLGEMPTMRTTTTTGGQSD